MAYIHLMHVTARAGSAFLVACGLSAFSLIVTAQSPAPALERKGPQVGAQVPLFSGVDQHGRTQTLQSVLKADGAMLVFYRSADW